MSPDHLYNPAQLSSWPVRLWRPVGTTYRNAAGEGLGHETCLRLAVGAYVAAGGKATGAERVVEDIVAALSAEKAGWLWEPAQAWLEGRSALTAVPLTSSLPRSAALEVA